MSLERIFYAILYFFYPKYLWVTHLDTCTGDNHDDYGEVDGGDMESLGLSLLLVVVVEGEVKLDGGDGGDEIEEEKMGKQLDQPAANHHDFYRTHKGQQASPTQSAHNHQHWLSSTY